MRMSYHLFLYAAIELIMLQSHLSFIILVTVVVHIPPSLYRFVISVSSVFLHTESFESLDIVNLLSHLWVLTHEIVYL